MAKTRRKTKAKKKVATQFSVPADEVEKHTSTRPLTPRDKKAILEKEIDCVKCKPARVLAWKVNDKGEPLCIGHWR